MAAYRACMCLLRKCQTLQKSTFAVLVSNYHRQCIHSRLIRNRHFPHQASLVIFYSTQKAESVKGLTDDILKAKVRAEQSQEKEGPSDKTKDDKPKKSTFKSRWTGKNAWKLGLIFLGGWSFMTVGGLVYMWGSPPRDPDGNIVTDEFSEFATVEAYIKRASKEFSSFRKSIQDPSREKLLPDPLQYPYIQPPYTLVLEMNGVLVHPDWTYNTGWRFKRRPYVDYFLQQLGPPLFEVVIYSQEQGMTADPIVNSLDPHGFVMYRLYRDATKYVNGHHVKDLSCLNRDLSKVIIVDWNERSYQLHPRNAFNVKKWTGKDDDRTLVDLANFLTTVAKSGVEDIRTVMEYYSQFDDPIEMFKENQRKLQEEQDRMSKFQSEQKQMKNTARSWNINPFRR